MINFKNWDLYKNEFNNYIINSLIEIIKNKNIKLYNFLITEKILNKYLNNFINDNININHLNQKTFNNSKEYLNYKLLIMLKTNYWVNNPISIFDWDKSKEGLYFWVTINNKWENFI